jgi:hypothetical protein
MMKVIPLVTVIVPDEGYSTFNCCPTLYAFQMGIKCHFPAGGYLPNFYVSLNILQLK